MAITKSLMYVENYIISIPEQLFDTLDKRARRTRQNDGRASPQIPIDETQLLDWLRGFQEIQAELNACVGCLEEGVSQIDTLQGNNDKSKSRIDENLNPKLEDGSPTLSSECDFEGIFTIPEILKSYDSNTNRSKVQRL